MRRNAEAILRVFEGPRASGSTQANAVTEAR
jgi:hypothetical protein